MEINIDSLKVFMLVVEEGSFSSAARKLYQSQPNVSLQIRSLENYFGAKLFERKGKRIELTFAGEEVYMFSKEVLLLSKRVKENVTSCANTINGKVYLGSGLTLSIYIMPHLISMFTKQNPRILVITQTNNYKDNIKALLKGLLDICVVCEGPKDESLEFKEFATGENILICSPHHPLAKQNQVLFTDIVEYPMVSMTKQSIPRILLEEKLQSQGYSPKHLNITMELDNFEGIRTCVEAGLGIAFVNYWGALNSLKAGSVYKVPLVGVDLDQKYYLAYRKERKFNEVSKIFLEYLLSNQITKFISNLTRMENKTGNSNCITNKILQYPKGVV